MGHAPRGEVRLLLAAALLVATLPLAAKEPAIPEPPLAKDRCQVCGMFVAPFPDWTAQVVYDEGRPDFFDGCKDLFKFLLHRDRYTGDGEVRRIETIFVTNYYDRKPIRAESAIFVTGSDVLGPMGHELIPHRSLEDAEEFKRDHRGRSILRFEEVTPEVLKTLR